jgi:hypothetical protein
MMTDNHQLWLDTINLQQQQGKTLEQALSVADMRPFAPFPNPLDIGYGKPKFNPSNHEDAPL